LSSPFEEYDDRDVIDLINAYPLASLVSCNGGYAVSSLPLLVETDDAGRPISLLGHIPKANPQVPILSEQPRTLVLFSGPEGYMSPEYVTTTRDWAPTWSFAVVRIVADVVLDDGLTSEAIEKLVSFMEKGRPQPWSIGEMGDRYDQLKQRVIGFRATIVSVEARFKLAQDERPEVLSSILERLDKTELVHWMQRCNMNRIQHGE
jgi:transcriptional regulator